MSIYSWGLRMFNDSKYTRWYFSIISRAILRKAGDENHHIIPRSMGGLNEAKNIVALTLREHFVVHLLLTRMPISSEHRWKMHYALSCFMTRGKGAISSRRFEICKRTSKKIPRRRPIGILHSEETKEKLRLLNIGKKQSQATIEKRNSSLRALRLQGKMKFNPLPSSALSQRYYDLDCGTKMAEGRRSSAKWLESVSSEESRQKRMLHSPKRKIIIIDGVEYPSLRAAARELNQPYSRIRWKSLHPPQ